MTATQCISAWCTQRSSAAAVQNSQLSPKLQSQQPTANSNDDITKFIESHSS